MLVNNLADCLTDDTSRLCTFLQLRLIELPKVLDVHCDCFTALNVPFTFDITTRPCLTTHEEYEVTLAISVHLNYTIQSICWHISNCENC